MKVNKRHRIQNNGLSDIITSITFKSTMIQIFIILRLILIKLFRFNNRWGPSNRIKLIKELKSPQWIVQNANVRRILTYLNILFICLITAQCDTFFHNCFFCFFVFSSAVDRIYKQIEHLRSYRKPFNHWVIWWAHVQLSSHAKRNTRANYIKNFVRKNMSRLLNISWKWFQQSVQIQMKIHCLSQFY